VSGVAGEQALIPDDPEDLKLITVARAALGRSGTPQSACVRDATGRAYAGTSVQLEHLRLSAIAVAVAMAVSSGATGVEAAALVGEEEPGAEDLAILRDIAVDGAAIWWVDPGGRVQSVIEIR
jgi:hypothetical protein